MNKDKLINDWLDEEKCAKIHGWDFSHIEGKYEEENDLPWNYKEIILQYLTPQKKLLDIDTGGKEKFTDFFLSSENKKTGSHIL